MDNIENYKKNSFESPEVKSDTIEKLAEKLLAVTTKLSESNMALAKLQKEREEMLSNISHDLRAPITAIRSAVDYINSSNDLSEEELRSSLGLIDRRTKTLENLIQDMYYLFCIEDSSRPLEFEEVPAIPFIEEYFYDTTIDSRYDTHDMVLDLVEQADCMVRIDIQKIIRVLDNLMTNAAKYSQEDSQIALKANICKGSSDQDVLAVSVSDNGPGIPEESIARIFNRTYTVSSARTPESQTGSGLGLAIVKAIVEKHGGTIKCESVVGEGSTFSFTLPIL